MIAIWKTLTLLQKVMAVILGLASIGVIAEATIAASDQDWLLMVSWLTVAVGIVLTWLDLAAFEYFRHQERLAGRSWLLRLFTRTAVTIALVCGWVTTARAASLLFGSLPIIPILTGLFIIWLMVIPILMLREFEDHEGR